MIDMKNIYSLLIALVALFAQQTMLNAQTLSSSSAEVSADPTTSTTLEDVDGASITLTVNIGQKVMLTASITMYASGSADAGYELYDATDTQSSATIIRTVNTYKGAASQVYVFTASSSGSHTYKLRHKIASGTLYTTASLAGVVLSSGGTDLQTDVQSVSSPVSTSSTTWAEVTGTATTAITTTTAGGFVVMASVQSAKTGGSSITGQWKLQYKVGAGGWNDLGYSVSRTTSGTGKGVANLVAGLGSASSAGTYYFRLLHRITDASGGNTMETQAVNIIATAFAHPTYTFQVLQGAKSLIQTTSNSYSDAIAMPATTNAGLTNPKVLMLGQFNMQANSTSDAPKFDFSVNSGAVYDGVDHERYLADKDDLGSAAMVGLASLSASTAYNLSMRHASNPTVPIRHIETSNILCIGVGLEDDQFIVYPVTVNATSGTTFANYNTLKEAFDAINIGTHKGDINISINTSTTETATAILYQTKKSMGGGKKSDYNYVNIVPTTQGVSIGGNFSGALIQLNGADNVTIDGRVNFTGTANMTIEQQETSSPAIEFINSAEDNVVQYSYIKAANASTTSGNITFGTSTGGAGNDDNIIQNNYITCSGSNKPAYTVYSHGSSGSLNTGNQILNNEFYDVFGSAAIHNVIFVSSYSTEFTISGNSFYMTSTVTAGTGGHYSFIHLENTAGNGFVVTNNYLGGSAAQCGGSAMTLNSAYGTYFETMDIHVGIAVPAEIYGNTVQNINYSSAYDHPYIGIEIVQGNANVHDNIVGSTSGTGSITVTNTTADCVVHGIYVSSEGDVNVYDNIIGGMTTVGSATVACSLEGIGKEYVSGYGSNVGSVVVSGNTVGNPTADNMLASSTAASASSGQYVSGIHIDGSGTNTISNNTVQNLTNSYTGTDSTGTTIGISTTSGTNTVTNNTVSNLTSSAAQTNTTSGAPVIGILQTSTDGVADVSNNEISGLSATSTTNVTVTGIYFSGAAAANTINSNLIYDLTNESTDNTSYIYGIQLSAGTTTVSNNILNIGKDETLGCNILGIQDNATAGVNNDFYFNTVYVSGTTSGTINSSSCFYRENDASTSVIEGNIFYNNRTGGTGGDHLGTWLSGITNVTTDYNDLYSTAGTHGRLSGTNYTTIGDWQTATSQAVNSVVADPLFDTEGGNLAVDYYVSEPTLSITNPTAITVDYSGITRGTPTLMGALERNDYHWQGGTSTDFNTASNWDEGVVPLSGANIIFNANPDRSCYLDQNRTVGNITIDQNTDILELNGFKLTFRGDSIVSTTGIIDADDAGEIVVFEGSGVQTFTTGAFVNSTMDGLELNNAYGLTLPEDITVNDLTLTDGALSIGANTLTINDAIATTSGTLVGGTSSNIVIGGSGAATSLPAVTLNDLTLNRANGISLGGDVTVGGALALTDGVLTVGANTFIYTDASITRTSGSIDASNASATLVFDNATQLTLPASVFSAAVNNLTIQNTGGVVASSDFTVNGVLNLLTNNPSVDQGLLDMGANTITMGANATTLGLGDVEGIIKRSSFAFDANLTFGNQFTYINFPTNALTMPTDISLKVQLVVPSWDSDAVLRVVDFIRTGGDAAITFTGAIHYTDGELNGNDETLLSVWEHDYSGPTTTELGRAGVNTSDNYVSMGVSTLAIIDNSFAAAEFCLEETSVTIVTWDGSESTDWTDDNNWDTGTAPISTDYVVIPDALTTPNDPTIPASTTIYSLTLESGAILNGGTGSLTIDGAAGAIINYGGTIIPATSTFTFTNANATISGENDFNNLVIDAGASLTPVVDAITRIAGTITNSGTWNTVNVVNTVEYNGNNQTVIIPNGATTGYYNLILSGTWGSKTMPGSALKVYGDMNISGTDITVNFAESFDVDGDFSTVSSSTVSTGAYSSIIGGDCSIAGYFGVNWSGTLTLDGSGTELLLAKTCSLEVIGTLVAPTSGYITFESDDSSTGQLFNNGGTITNTDAVVRLKKEMLQSTGWYFMSMPYDVPSSRITDVSTGDTISFGSLTDTYKEIYVGTYDGYNRDQVGTPSASAGVYWINPPATELVQNKGYIIATERDKTYYFSSAAGETDLFASIASETVAQYTTNADTTHHSWNLVGNPFSSGFDLIQASQDQAPFYIYNGYNYDVVMAGDNYTAYPFQAFFMQAFGGTTLSFATAGLEFRSAVISEPVAMDEIDLYIEDTNGKIDRVRVRFRDDATVGFNPGKDAVDFRSMDYTVPQLYAPSSGKNYAVHALAPVESGTMSIPLTMFIGKAGTYKIRIADAKGKITHYTSVILKDNVKGTQTELMLDSVYTFTANYGTTTTRMALVVGERVATSDIQTISSGDEINAIVNSGKVSFSGLKGNATVEVIDLSGRIIGSFSQISNYEALPISLYGVYLLKVKTESQNQQFKLFIGK